MDPVDVLGRPLVVGDRVAFGTAPPSSSGPTWCGMHVGTLVRITAHGGAWVSIRREETGRLSERRSRAVLKL